MPANTCPNCGHDAGEARAYCPRCGAKMKRGGGGGIALLAALVFLLGCAWFFNSAWNSRPDDQSVPAETTRPVSLLATPAPTQSNLNEAGRSQAPAPTRSPTPDPPPARPSDTVADEEPAAEDDEEITVYVTRTGAKYHRGSCRYLRQSKIPMPLDEAREQYDPCSVCDPPE